MTQQEIKAAAQSFIDFSHKATREDREEFARIVNPGFLEQLLDDRVGAIHLRPFFRNGVENLRSHVRRERRFVSGAPKIYDFKAKIYQKVTAFHMGLLPEEVYQDVFAVQNLIDLG